MKEFEKLQIKCSDGYPLAARLYSPANSNGKNLLINSATAVDKQLYHHYSIFMAEKGYTVVTYDYRGIAESRPEELRGFKASFVSWGELDYPAVAQYIQNRFPNNRLFVLGHSIGGVIFALSPECANAEALINIGVQTSYWKDWQPFKQRIKLYLLWHVLFPMITPFFGYFPGKRLGFLEDVPKGVMEQWHSRRRHPDMVHQFEKKGHKNYFSDYQRKLWTIGIADDPIGSPPAVRRLEKHYTKAEKSLDIIQLEEVGTDAIGHFGFFRRKFKETLWRKTLEWYDGC